MRASFQEKVSLGAVTHSVRAAQAVLQYGVGAMVDFPDQTLMTAQPEYWSGTQKIYDERFAKALKVKHFAMPSDIAYARFPEWYFCPRCRKFQPLNKWIAEYAEKSNNRSIKYDPHMVSHLQCPKCNQDLVVARIVTICEQGHINDFPWVQWVHAKNTYGKKDVCANPVLQFKTGASGTEGLEGLTIACSCGASATLKGAFGNGKSEENPFERLDKDVPEPKFMCQGHHPQRHIKEKCMLYPKTVQRGSSSVYFPVVYSSLVIPPYADALNMKIEQSKAFDECEITLSKLPDMRNTILEAQFDEWVEQIAFEISAAVSDVESVLRRKWWGEDDEIIDVLSVRYRAEEYEALSGEVTIPHSDIGDFSREEMNITDYDLPHIKSIVLIDKVRVVNALIGFSRINPVASEEDEGFVHIKETATPWYPAYEVKGEGVFIEFDPTAINEWINKNPQVFERAKRLNDNYAASFIGRNHPQRITSKLVMLHTLSHILIKQLSFECGYSVASLSERLYCAEKEEGREMAGIFIYTASGDSEGTLGGLVRQGRPDAFVRIFKKAIIDAQTCSNDPICVLSHGQGRDSLNLAACHACALLPETCCEKRNGFLDRALITGTFEEPSIGFYSSLLA